MSCNVTLVRNWWRLLNLQNWRPSPTPNHLLETRTLGVPFKTTQRLDETRWLVFWAKAPLANKWKQRQQNPVYSFGLPRHRETEVLKLLQTSCDQVGGGGEGSRESQSDDVRGENTDPGTDGRRVWAEAGEPARGAVSLWGHVNCVTARVLVTGPHSEPVAQSTSYISL